MNNWLKHFLNVLGLGGMGCLLIIVVFLLPFVMLWFELMYEFLFR